MNKFEITKRPNFTQRTTGGETRRALERTAITGRALHFKKKAPGHLSGFRPFMTVAGLRMHTATDHNGGCYAWCEKIEAKP